jgi:hypothetical protein
MIIAPGVDCLTEPLLKAKYANNIPKPGPGFVSIKKNMDFPSSLAC